MLLIYGVTAGVVLALLTAIVGMVALSSSLIGYLAAPLLRWHRVILFAGGLMMIKPGLITDVAGITIFAAILFLQMRGKRGI